jgi:uroporphyrinogen-III synthase
MRVVVTRPERSGQKTATLLRERGHWPILLSLTAPVHYAEVAIAALAKQPAALAVTSAEAIRALLETDISAIRHTLLFAVGPASAGAARDAGFQNIVAGESDGSALAQLIAQAQAPKTSVLYLAGKPREPGFEDRLFALNVPFETAEIYEMQPVFWTRPQLEDLLTASPINAVLFYSTEAVRIFFALMSEHALFERLNTCKFICISSKVLSHIPKAFQHAAQASATPSEAEMFDLLDRAAGT